jgi:hypothetical protein
MKYLLLLPLMLLLSWQKEDNKELTVDLIKADRSFIHYMQLIKAHQKALIEDEWGLRTEKVKKDLEDAKKNKTSVEFSKTLRNKKGVSLYTARTELMKAYLLLAARYSLKNEDNKKLFNQAIQQYYTEHR